MREPWCLARRLDDRQPSVELSYCLSTAFSSANITHSACSLTVRAARPAVLKRSAGHRNPGRVWHPHVRSAGRRWHPDGRSADYPRRDRFPPPALPAGPPIVPVPPHIRRPKAAQTAAACRVFRSDIIGYQHQHRRGTSYFQRNGGYRSRSPRRCRASSRAWIWAIRPIVTFSSRKGCTSSSRLRS